MYDKPLFKSLMPPKILFTDIDGTLLNKDRELSAITIREINRIHTTLSIPVILVSARMPESMRLLQAQLGLQNELIAYNGSLVLGKGDSLVLHDEKVSSNVSLQIIEKANSAGLHFSVFSTHSWMISRDDEWAEKERRNTKVLPKHFNELKFQELIKDGTHKIMLMGDPVKINALQLWMKESLDTAVNYYRSKNTYLEINPVTSTKLTGVNKILSLYNLTLADAIAIGDNHNDTDMIKQAGFGVAVDNAPDEIKKAANFVSASNINDGVAAAIKKFF